MKTLNTQEQKGYENFERVYRYLINKTNKTYDEIERIEEVCILLDKNWRHYLNKDAYYSVRNTQLRFWDNVNGGFTKRQALFKAIEELAEHIDKKIMLENN